MTEAIMFRAVWSIKAGKLEEAKRHAKSFADAVAQAQPGTRFTGLYVTPDGRSLVVHEVHANAEAALAHLTGSAVPAYMPKFQEVADGPAFEVFGGLTPELEGMVKPLNPVIHAPAAGFLR